MKKNQLFCCFFAILCSMPITVLSGASSSKAASTKSTGSTDAKAVNPAAQFTFQTRPIQIVYPDPETHSKLLINEENIKLLNSLDNKKVAIVGAVGPFHSGKSFLLNQLMDVSDTTSSGFQLGYTTDPQTKGLWMWGTPVHVKQQSTDEDLTLLFLDTEGFYSSNVSEAYDAKIFAVATLMSSYLLYNSVKMIDQSSIENVELLARRTQLFGLRAEMANEKFQEEYASTHLNTEGNTKEKSFQEQMISFPKLLWVVEDFFQDLQGQTCTQWLHRLLDAKRRDSVESLPGNFPTKTSLGDIFPSTECHTLFLPHTEKEKLRHLDRATQNELTKDYLDDLEALQQKVFENIRPKMKNQQDFADGPALSSLLRLLVFYANHGEFPAIPSVWNGFLEISKKQAVEDCVEQFQERMDKVMLEAVLPEDLLLSETDQSLFDSKHRHHLLNSVEFQRVIDDNRREADDLLKHLLFGMEDVAKPALDTLHVELSGKAKEYSNENEKRIIMLIQMYASAIFKEFEQKIHGISLPLSSKTLEDRHNEISARSLKDFSNYLEKYRDMPQYKQFYADLERNLAGSSAQHSVQNQKEIEKRLNDAVASVSSNSLEVLREKINAEKPLSSVDVKSAIKDAEERAWREFDRLVEPISLEKSLNLYRNEAKKSLELNVDNFKKQNEDNVKKVVEDQVEEVARQFQESMKSVYAKLPVDESEMDADVKKLWNPTLNSFEAGLKNFTGMDAFEAGKLKLKSRLDAQIHNLKKANIDMITTASQASLERAKTIISEKADDYYFTYSFTDFAYGVADQELKSTVKSDKIRKEVIANFFEQYLQSELDAVTTRTRTSVAVGLLVLAATAAIGYNLNDRRRKIDHQPLHSNISEKEAQASRNPRSPLSSVQSR